MTIYYHAIIRELWIPNAEKKEHNVSIYNAVFLTVLIMYVEFVK